MHIHVIICVLGGYKSRWSLTIAQLCKDSSRHGIVGPPTLLEGLRDPLNRPLLSWSLDKGAHTCTLTQGAPSLVLSRLLALPLHAIWRTTEKIYF